MDETKSGKEEKAEKKKEKEPENKKKEAKEETEETILLDNVNTFMDSAQMLYLKKDFTSATIIYFKALFSILDLRILKDKGKAPKDHGERFRMLEKEYIDLYVLLDKIYPVYRETYSIKITKDICDSIKKDVERIAKEQGILQNSK